MKYIYLQENVLTYSANSLLDHLNKRGGEGWLLITKERSDSGKEYVFLTFVREDVEAEVVTDAIN